MKLPPFTAELGWDSPAMPYRGHGHVAGQRPATAWAVTQWCSGIAVVGCLACPEEDCLPRPLGG